MVSYYRKNKAVLEIKFRMWINRLKNPMKSKFSLTDSQLHDCILEAKKHFQNSLEHLPDIGGSDNPMIEEFVFYSWWVVIYKCLTRYSLDSNEIGKFLYENSVSYFKSLSKEEIDRTREKWFTEGKEQFRICSDSKNYYPENWKYDFVEGNGRDFDFGVNFTECAIKKYFVFQGVGELLKYVCAMDYAWSDVFGMGVSRPKSIINGDNKCVLRWKKR